MFSTLARYDVVGGVGGNARRVEETGMNSTVSGAPALVARLSRMDGAWAGDVVRPEGSFVGRQQLSCCWDAQQRVLRVKSCLLSRVGRVLGAEEVQIAYDLVAGGPVAHFRHGAGRAHLLPGARDDDDEVVLVYDADLRLRRITWPFGLEVDAASGAPGDGALTVRLGRVAWLPRGQAGDAAGLGGAL
jgi:hypothetical protein